jgi:minor extracellular serine protease Vpr
MNHVRPSVKTLLGLLCAASVAFAVNRADRYAVILESPPLAQQGQTEKTTKQKTAIEARAAIASAQASVRSAIQKSGARVTSSNQLLVNALFVEATPEQAEQLRQAPGVALVDKLRPMKRHLNKALDLMNVPAAWGSVGGEQNAGTGVKIAVLDTGIDQNHAAFQENGLQYPAGFPKGDAGYTNRKVIAARSYVNMLVGTDPKFTRPDDLSPRDRVGHGTAMAMIAAGARNTGPVATITGVAPRAWLGNYKVFGSPGVNGQYTYDSVIIQALEDATSDGMDIAVLSLGAPAVWGPLDRGATCNNEGTRACDWRADAVENAARLGLTVVVSAGNDGDFATQYPGYNSIQTPGSAPSAITVGATTNSHFLFQSVQMSGANKIPALFGNGPLPRSALTAPLKDVSKLQNNGRACSPLANGSLSGSIALIERGDCTLHLKVLYAQRAGAMGAIIYQGANIQGVFKMDTLQETGIPAVLVGNTSGVALKNFAAGTPNGNVTLDASFYETQTNDYDTVAFFSSRGPSIRESAIKPELVAVGTDLYVATQNFDSNGDMYDPGGYTNVQGTSFAAAFAAGAAALVKQRNPQWNAAQIKSALVNTATSVISDYDQNGNRIQASVLDIGAGKLNAANAVQTNVAIEPATLSFGLFTSTPPSQTLKIRNSSNSSVSLTLQVRASFGLATLVSLDQRNITLAPGEQKSVTASLSGPKPSPGVYEGAINISGGAVDLHVPYLYLVGDGVPYSVVPLEGSAFEAEVGKLLGLTYKVVDQYGVPVPNVRTDTRVQFGGGSVKQQSNTTDDLGIGYADVNLGGQYGDQEFYVAVGNRENFGIYFDGRARLVPTISSGGVVNLASGQLGQGVAPGSYVSIFGRALSEGTRVFSTPYLPLALSGVSVSFDVPSQNLSVPARIHFVSDGQINVQVPWELRGATSAIVKVSIGDTSSDIVTVPLNEYAPAVFEYTEPSGGRSLPAVLDSAYGLVGTSNPAKRNDVVQIFVNGLGPVDNQPASGDPSPSQPLASTRVVPEVSIGGKRAEILFSGLTPGIVGLYQVNARIPADAASGLQPLVIRANGIVSKSVTIPVGP